MFSVHSTNSDGSIRGFLVWFGLVLSSTDFKAIKTVGDEGGVVDSKIISPVKEELGILLSPGQKFIDDDVDKLYKFLTVSQRNRQASEASYSSPR
jgi:hypothetical protein